MPSTYTSRLRLELQATGENTSTWGTKANNVFSLTEAAIAGYQSIALADANLTLSTANGASDQARNMILDFTGALTADRTITIPTVSKVYYMRNSTTGGFSLNVKTSVGNTITIGSGNSINFFCDGTNCVKGFELDLAEATGTLPVANGGTGSTTASAARTALGVAIGTNVQAWDTNLDQIAALAVTDGNIIVGNGSAWVAESGATARTSLGVSIGSDVQAWDTNLDQIAALAVTDGNFIVGNGTAWVAESGATARTSLGLGSLATASTINNADWSGTDLAVANGGTGASDAATARTNLGLGTAATANTGTSGATVPLLSTSNTWSNTQTFNSHVTLEDAASHLIFSAADTDTYMDYVSSGTFRVVCNNDEILRFSDNTVGGGGILIGKTVSDGGDTVGVELEQDGTIDACVNGSAVLKLNRLTNDGVLANFEQAGVNEGSIEVTGTTISYNAFLGSHWSQLADGSRPDIPIGTICDSISQLCSWPKDDEKGRKNNRLPRFKISDIDASKAVYGIFLKWDNDDLETNDATIASIGAGWVRMQAGETVAIGDYVQSAGNGCGKVQADDILRASTVAKITSTEVIETYKDGSFRVPATLHCG